MRNKATQTLKISCFFFLLSAGILFGCNQSRRRGTVPTGNPPPPPPPHKFVTSCNAVFNELSVCLQTIDISYYQGNEAIKQEIVACEQTANGKLQKARKFLTEEQNTKKTKEFKISVAVAKPAIQECVKKHLLFSRPAAISCIIQRYQTWQTQICAL